MKASVVTGLGFPLLGSPAQKEKVKTVQSRVVRTGKRPTRVLASTDTVRRFLRNSNRAATTNKLQQKSDAEVWEEVVDILHVNIQGAISSWAELTATLRSLKRKPLLVCLNETFLDESTKELTLEGYVEVARRDREGRQGGGVLVYTLKSQASNVTLLDKSEDSERVWVVVHSEQGPVLVGAWYRPPEQGEVATVHSFREEWKAHRGEAIGAIVVGDINIHHRKWLRWSGRNSAEGQTLQDYCRELGVQQVVREPTRGENLLDLVLTDMDNVDAKVLPRIADHKVVLVTLKLRLPVQRTQKREVWNYAKGNWEELKQQLAEYDWQFVRDLDAEQATTGFTDVVLELSEDSIGKKTVCERKSTHPWLTDKVC